MAGKDESVLTYSGIAADQRRRWRGSGEPLLVEAYLAQAPFLAAQDDFVLSLLLNELVLRGERGDSPSLEDYQRRFPALADELPELFGRFATLRMGVAAEEITTTEVADSPALPRVKTGSRLPEIPGYEVLEFIAAGGQGEIYRARHQLLRRVVALKILNQRGDDEETLARFSREGRLAALLDHPNLLRIFDCARSEGRLFISMEFAAGGSLADRLKVSSMEPLAAAELVRTLAGAVQHLYDRHQIVHRDLKPSNVLFMFDGTPKVADFGLAKRLSADATRLTKGSEVLGTASYMAPEQAAGRTRDVTAATDVYALGAILYECLTGEPPFRGESWLETIDMVRHQPLIPPSRRRPRIPAALEQICLNCLAKLPEERYPGAGQLREDLDRYLQGGSVGPLLAPINLPRPASQSRSSVRPRSPLPVATVSGWPDIPGYEILDELGEGETGRVFKAREVRLGRLVALKVLRPIPEDIEQDSGKRRGWGRAWKLLHPGTKDPVLPPAHANIAQIYDLGDSRDGYYVATELVSGGSLSRFLRNPWLPVDAVVELMAQVSEAAGFCHARGLIHRNLKPSNILLAPPDDAQILRQDCAARVFGIPKLTDFECAQVVSVGMKVKAALGRLLHPDEEKTQPPQTESVVGTPGYMAPEQAAGDLQGQSPATDVFSLGVMLYELVTGESPWLPGEPIEKLVTPHERRSAVPRDLSELCMQCLARRAEDRLANGLELGKSLSNWLDRSRQRQMSWWRRVISWGQP